MLRLGSKAPQRTLCSISLQLLVAEVPKGWHSRAERAQGRACLATLSRWLSWRWALDPC